MVGVGITLVGATVIKSEILTPIQMLWINLVMDALASLALATESPEPSLLDRQPHSRNDYIVNKKMFKHVVGQAIYQMCVLCLLTFYNQMIPELSDNFDAEIQKNIDFCGGGIKDSNGVWQSTDSNNAWGLAKSPREYCALWSILGYRLKYGNTCSTGEVCSLYSSLEGSHFVRSGREKTMVDKDRLFPQVGDETFMGSDYATIFENLQSAGPSRHYTVVFNTFLWMTIFNFINARKL